MTEKMMEIKNKYMCKIKNKEVILCYHLDSQGIKRFTDEPCVFTNKCNYANQLGCLNLRDKKDYVICTLYEIRKKIDKEEVFRFLIDTSDEKLTEAIEYLNNQGYILITNYIDKTIKVSNYLVEGKMTELGLDTIAKLYD